MKNNSLIILLLSVVVSHAQHAFFRGTNNYVAPVVATTQANALNFDSSLQNYATLPAATYFSGDFTIECWIKPTSYTNWSRIIDFGNGAGNNCVLFSTSYGTSGKPGFYVGGAQFEATSQIPLNQWTHLAATLSGSIATIYINGVASGTANFPTPANVTRNYNYIGRSNWGWGDPAPSASFDDLRIWSVAKTGAEIISSMNNELSGNESNLVAYFKFNEGVSCGNNTAITTLVNSASTGAQYNATLSNFTLNGSCVSNFASGITIGSNSIISNGLVMHLDAGNTASYPGSGSTWTDLSGNGYNGTLTNGPAFSSLNAGSIVFDGSDDVASFGDILNMGLNSWTLSSWVKINDGSGLAGIIGKTSYRGYVGRYSFYIENNDLHAFFQPDVNYSVTTPIAPYLDNKFHNLVMTINRTSMMYFYIDGVSVGTPLNVSGVSSINLNSSTDNFYIGSYGSSNGQSPQYFLNGNVSQASIYSRALTAAEVLQNYNALSPRFGDVTNPTTGKTWMDRNLGASQVAISSTDTNAYGDLYQWGRGTDGHQLRSAASTSTLSSSVTPGNNLYIINRSSPYDWISPQNANLWQGASGVNNPCPSGFRVPTEAEWAAEVATWSSGQNATGAFASPLKLPLAGYRYTHTDALTNVGTIGHYWTSTVSDPSYSYAFDISSSNAVRSIYGRVDARSVRCIQN